MLHDLYHIRNDGIVTIVLPHGVLFRGGEEGTIRKNLIDHNNIDAIIGLPANIFFGTGIPTIIMVLRKNKRDSDVLILMRLRALRRTAKTTSCVPVTSNALWMLTRNARRKSKSSHVEYPVRRSFRTITT